MSIKVNTREIKIQQHDSIITIMDRIAMLNKSPVLPSQLIVIKDDEILTRDEFIKIINDIKLSLQTTQTDEIPSLKLISQTYVELVSPLVKSGGMDPSVGYSKIKKIIPDKKVYLFHWINIFLKKDQKCEILFSAEKYQPLKIFLDKFIPNINENIFCDEYRGYFEHLKDETREFERRKEFYKLFDETVKRKFRYATTPFVIDRSIITLQVKIPNGINYHDLFDDVRLSNITPLAYLHTVGIDSENNYYKVLDNFDVPDEWVKRHKAPSRMVMRVAHILNEKNLEDIIAKKALRMYSTALWTILDEKEGIAEVVISVTLSKGIKPDEIIQRMFDSFDDGTDRWQNIEIKSRKETSGGTYAVGNIALNKRIFLDMLTNHPIISKFFHVDEVVKVTTAKKNLYIYLETADSILEGVTATLTQYRANMDLYGKKIKALEPYINLRIHAKDSYFIDIFRAFFDYAMDIYNNDYDKIVAIYHNLVEDDETLQKEYGIKEPILANVSKLKMLKEVNPELFGGNYSKDCDVKLHPTYVDPAEVKDHQDRNVPILEFPEGSGDYYRCDNPTHKYPYLKQASKKSDKDFPFIPCCAILDPMKKSVSAMLAYKGLVDERRVAKQIIFKPKQMQPTRRGKLTRVLENFFSIHTGTDKSSFTRLGVSDITAPDSILQCLLRIYNKDFQKLEKLGRTEFTNDYRKNILAKDELSIASGKQELYDMSTTEIRKEISIQTKSSSLKGYLDPRKYVSVLESHFKCNIFMFTGTLSEPDGTILLPNYRDTYYIYPLNTTRDNVYIYCHNIDGIYVSEIISIDDQLIFRYDEGRAVNLPEIIFRLKMKMLQSLTTINDKFQNDILRNRPKIELFKGQIIDGAGKLRAVVTDNGVIVALPPSPPLPLKILPQVLPTGMKNGTPIANIKLVLEFIKSNDLTVDGNYIDDTMKGLVVHDDNSTYFLPYTGRDVFLDNLPDATLPFNISFPTQLQVSLLNKYIKTRKIADYLRQYIIYAFSRYIHEEINKNVKDDNLSISNIPQQYIENFEKNNIIVKQIDYYKIYIPVTFNTDIDIFENGQLIVSNEIIMDKLIYYLKTILNLSNEYVATFIDHHNSLMNYAQEHADFTHKNREVIFLNIQSFARWVREKSSFPTLHLATNIQHAQITLPYFLKALDDKIFIIQNVPSLRVGININKYWTNYSINIGYHAKPAEDDNINENQPKIREYHLDSRGYAYVGKNIKNADMTILKYPTEKKEKKGTEKKDEKEEKIAVMLEIKNE